MLKQVPALLKLKKFTTPFYGLVSRFIKDEHLRKVFFGAPLISWGVNPYTTTSIYTLIHYLERKWGRAFSVWGGTGRSRGCIDAF